MVKQEEQVSKSSQNRCQIEGTAYILQKEYHTRTVHAFITVATNPRVAEVTGGIMVHQPIRCGRSRTNRSRRAIIDMRRRAVRIRPNIAFTIATVNIMNMDASWVFKLKKFMEGIVALSGAHLDTCCTEVKVYRK